MRALAALAFAALLSAPALGADWAVDPARSTLSFEATAQGQKFTTIIKEWTAEIAFDPADLSAANARVVVNLGSVASGDGQRDSMMIGKSWFDIAGATFTAPPDVPAGQAVFQTTAFRKTGDASYEAEGTLTMRDALQTVTLPFTLAITGAEAHMSGAVSIDRTLWGVGQGQFAGSDPVATEVNIRVELYATAP